MALEDSKVPFLRIPWAAALLNRPNVVCRVPGSREPKSSTEDSLFAETLKTLRTLRSCVSFYRKPSDGDEVIGEVSTLLAMGDGMNGHPRILHGGMVATVIDEAMGVLLTVNKEREHLASVGRGHAEGELLPHGLESFTAELKIRYLKPVRTPDCLLVTARYVRRDGRKEWVFAEIKQRDGIGEDYDGEEVLCATGEALFVTPKPKRSNL